MILIRRFGEGICYIELNRPEKQNAINKKMVQELITFLEIHAESTQFKLLIISGNEGFFSSGTDPEWLKQGLEQSYQENLEDARLFSKLFNLLWNFPKPIIAKVERGALGEAIGLLACSDIVITTREATFSFNEISYGYIPATVAPYIIKKTGLSVARHLLLSGTTFSGEDALRYNLAHIITPTDKLGVKTREIALNIIKNETSVIKETKNLLNRLGDSFDYSFKEIERICNDLSARNHTHHNS